MCGYDLLCTKVKINKSDTKYELMYTFLWHKKNTFILQSEVFSVLFSKITEIL